MTRASSLCAFIEVEFKLLREGAFRAAEPLMFYYDLLAAHQIVWGSPDFA